MVDALALGADEGRGKLRKATGRCKRPLIRGYPNGATRMIVDHALHSKYIAMQGELGELKHLSNPRNRK